MNVLDKPDGYTGVSLHTLSQERGLRVSLRPTTMPGRATSITRGFVYFQEGRGRLSGYSPRQ
ncbi:hypothetical protein [Stenotrophomonas phage CM2]